MLVDQLSCISDDGGHSYEVGRRVTGLVSDTANVESLVALEEGVALGGDGGDGSTLGVLGNTGINGARRREGGDDDGGTHFDGKGCPEK